MVFQGETRIFRPPRQVVAPYSSPTARTLLGSAMLTGLVAC